MMSNSIIGMFCVSDPFAKIIDFVSCDVA